MLGKLLKYEFKSTARIFLPLYGILLGFALLSRFSIAGMDTSLSNNRLIETLMGITIFGYVMVIFSTLIVTFVIVVQRFYKNLTGDEGYLMHTLPVSTHKLLQAKLVAAICWEFLSGVAIVISMFMLFLNAGWMRDIAEAFGEIGGYFAETVAEIGGGRMALIIGELVLLMLIATIAGTLVIYAAISIGHTFKKHRVLGGAAAFIGLQMVTQTVTGMVTGSLSFANFGYNQTAVQGANAIAGILAVLLLLEIGYSCAWYFISHYVLTSQLNLE